MVKSDLFVEDENDNLIPFPLIVLKSVKNGTDRKSQRKLALERLFKICLQVAWHVIQKHVWPPLKLYYVNFNPKNTPAQRFIV